MLRIRNDSSQTPNLWIDGKLLAYWIPPGATTKYFPVSGYHRVQLNRQVFDVNVEGLMTLSSSGQLISEPETLQSGFDPQQYMGRWYQIAAIPQPYAPNCPQSVAYYSLIPEGIQVYNECRDRGRVVNSVRGVATILGPATLRVDFPIPAIPKSDSQASNIPYFTGTGPNYLIHETNYQYAIVGSPDRSSLYILSRNPQMSDTEYSRHLHRAQELGYDVSLLHRD